MLRTNKSMPRIGVSMRRRDISHPNESHLPQTSENNASTISRHFTPGITLRSIWFIT